MLRKIVIVLLAGGVSVAMNSCGPKKGAVEKADRNGDGKISTGEMEGALVNAIFDAADRNKDGSVNYAEWNKIFPEMSEEEYARHDLGSKGSFTREEAHAYCDKKNTFDKLIGKIDTSGDGFIDKDEAGVFKEKLRSAEGANSVQKLDSLMN